MNIKRLPLWRDAVEDLEQAGMLSHGSVIPRKWFESAFAAESDSMPFTREMIPFRKALRERGFILTQRGMNGDYRICAREEMAEIVRAEEFRKAHRSALNAACLGAVDTSEMDEIEVKKLKHWEERAGLNAAIQLHILRRKTLPTPEMAIKSLKQIS